MSDKIVGKKVWITRDYEHSNFDIWQCKPQWNGWVWDVETETPLTRICDAAYFRRWLGRSPTAKLNAGGPEAIEEATLYVAIDWGHDG
jgi:hypothetical protein